MSPQPQTDKRLPLYIGCSLADLDWHAATGIAHVTSTSSVNMQLVKLQKSVEDAAANCDEEKLYIFYKQFIILTERLMHMSDTNDLGDRFDLELQIAKDEAQRLGVVLQARYRTDLHVIGEELSALLGHTPDLASCLSTIDARELASLMSCTEPASTPAPALLVIDLRSAWEFASCRLNVATVVNIDARKLAPGSSLESVQSQLAAAAAAAQLPAASARVLVAAWGRRLSDQCASAVASLAGILGQSSTRFLADGLRSVAHECPWLLTDPDYPGPGGAPRCPGWSQRLSLTASEDAASVDSRSEALATSSPTGASAPAVNASAAKEPKSGGALGGCSLDGRANRTWHSLAEQLRQLSAQSDTDPDLAADSKLEPLGGPVDPGLTGLQNCGNTCYMNCVLQCLNNTAPLAAYFLARSSSRSPQSPPPASPPSGGSDLAVIFARLCRALWRGAHASVNPAELRAAVDRHVNSDAFDSAEQQDAQEFLLFLLDGLHEDLNLAAGRSKLACSDSSSGGGGGGEEAWAGHLALNDSIVVDLFQGQLKSTLSCDHCGCTSATYEAFMYFSLPVVGDSDCTLDDCVDGFFQSEHLSGSCQWHCPRCRRQRDAVKRLDLSRQPRCLLIHLKRFRSAGGGSGAGRKISTRVAFPLDSLSLGRYACQQQRLRGQDSCPHSSYRLYAVCDHFGSMDSGHYTATCLHPVAGEWHRFDDDSVSGPLPPEEVASAAAYILFYTAMAADPREARR